LHVIIGVDPGTTLAIAAFGLDGKFVGAWSARDAGKDAAVRRINDFGTPALIATDVSIPPDLVVKLASDYNVRIFSPPQNLPVKEKLELARKFDYENEHELDAIAAARRAYRAYENKLRLIDRVLAEKGEAQKADAVKQLVIGGLSVHRALLFLEPKPAQVQHAQTKPAPVGRPNQNELSYELQSAFKTIMELRKALERLEAERKSLAERLAEHEKGMAARMRESAEIRRLQRRIYILEEILHKIRTRKKRPSEQQQKQKEQKKNLKQQAANEKQFDEQPAEHEKQFDVEALVSAYRQDR